MRAALALSLVLLALTLALNHERELFPPATPPTVLADRALEIVVGARGPLLPPAHVGAGPERIDAAVRLGERTFVPQQDGLYALFLDAGGAVRREQVFDLARGGGEALALRRAVEEAGEGELLVLASRGRIEAPAGAEGEELARALAALGARAQPGATTPESWALIALSLEDGWVPLAEGYSTASGVALCFVLGAEREAYADFHADRVRVPGGARSEVFLEDELGRAAVRGPGVDLRREGSVGGRKLPAILLPAANDAEGRAVAGRVAWNDVTLGPGSGLIAWLGLADGASEGSDGARLELRVDGALVQGATVLPGAPWRVFQADLRPFAGRHVTLELVVEPLASAGGDALLIGRPVLVQGYDRSPLEAWADER